MDILVDGQKVVTWTSSGTTAGFEAVELGGITGQMVELQGVLADSEWLSIMEVRVALYLCIAGFKICCVGVMCLGLFRRSRNFGAPEPCMGIAMSSSQSPLSGGCLRLISRAFHEHCACLGTVDGASNGAIYLNLASSESFMCCSPV